MSSNLSKLFPLQGVGKLPVSSISNGHIACFVHFKQANRLFRLFQMGKLPVSSISNGQIVCFVYFKRANCLFRLFSSCLRSSSISCSQRSVLIYHFRLPDILHSAEMLLNIMICRKFLNSFLMCHFSDVLSLSKN